MRHYPTNPRGFRIMYDAKNNFAPCDGIAQFEYKGYMISISTAGLSIGACQTEVAVFKEDKIVQLTNTVEEAINFCNGE